MMTTGTEIRLYHCQDNDNLIRLIYEDGELDEIQVSDELAREWIVLSWKDLENATRIRRIDDLHYPD